MLPLCTFFVTDLEPALNSSNALEIEPIIHVQAVVVRNI